MSLPDLARWAIAACLTVVFALAALNDVRTRKIPNWTILVGLVLFAGWAALHPLEWDLWALGAGALAFGVTFGLYSAGLVGAGDSKLFTVAALFAGMSHLDILALATAVAGGAVVLIGLIARPVRAMVLVKMKGQGDFGQGVPYGVAIAIAGASLTWAILLGVHLPGLFTG